MKQRGRCSVFFFFLYCIAGIFLSIAIYAKELPQGFVYVEEKIPNIVLEIRYASNDNFVGKPVDGYLKARSILTEQAAVALSGVQEDLNKFGLGLKVFDTYRPQRAVNHFVRWAADLKDVKMRKKYFPNVKKEDLFKDGYIAEKSGHSRGSTVDLTLVALEKSQPPKEFKMGTTFDYFGPESWPDNPTRTPLERANRLLLKTLMEKHGFKSYDKEWWHFTLVNEPNPDTYFDFPVE